MPPEFQNPQISVADSLSKTELPAQVQQALGGYFAIEPEQRNTGDTHSDPAKVLGNSAVPLPLNQIEARFKGKSGWKKGLPTLLETLEALGRAQRGMGGDAGDGAPWRASLQ